MLLQGPDAGFELADYIAEADEVFLGGREFSFGLGLSVAELGDARRFLEYLTSVLALGGEYLAYSALPYHRVAVAAETRVHKELVYVAEPHLLFVYVVFALARTEVTAGDGHFVEVVIEKAVGVIEVQGYLGVAVRLSYLGAVKDDVLHLAAAKRLGAHLAEHPADGVGDVALARAVGADDGGEPVGEVDGYFIGEGFEPLHRYRV